MDSGTAARKLEYLRHLFTAGVSIVPGRAEPDRRSSARTGGPAHLHHRRPRRMSGAIRHYVVLALGDEAARPAALVRFRKTKNRADFRLGPYVEVGRMRRAWCAPMTLRFKFRDSFVATSTSMDTTNATEPKKIPPPRTEAICNAARPIVEAIPSGPARPAKHAGGCARGRVSRESRAGPGRHAPSLRR